MGHAPRSGKPARRQAVSVIASIINVTIRKDDVIDYDTLIVSVHAADVLDMDNSGEMLLFMKTLIQGGVKKLLVDMNGLEFIDSAGIGMLVESAKLLRQRKGDLALIGVPERIQRIFQPIKLNRFIKIFDSQEEVISYFRLI